MANKLEQFLVEQAKKKDVPLMTDESYFPQTGEVTMKPENPAMAKVPVKGATLGPKGEILAPIQGIQVGAAKTPISQPEVDKIKQQFKLTPEAPVVPPTAPAPIPEKKMEEPKKGFDWSSLLPALAPLATEALMSGGGTAGESLGISGKYLLDEEAKKEARKRELENKLLEIQARRDIASMKAKGKEKPLTAANTLPYVDEEGKVRYGLVGETIGKEKPMEQPKGLTMEQREKLQYNSFKNRMALEEKRSTERAGSRFQDKLLRDKEYVGLQSQVANTDKAIEYLSQGKNIADEGVKKVFAKGIFGDVGNIAVQEAAAIAENPSIYNKYTTLKAKFEQGVQFGDTDRADMMEFAMMIRNAAPAKMKAISDRLSAAETNISGKDVSKIANSLVTVPNSEYPKVKVVIGGNIFAIDPKDYPRAVREKGAKLYIGKK